MPTIVVRFPTGAEEDRSRRFAAHQNYLGSMALFLGALYGDRDARPAGLLAAQRALPAFRAIQRRPLTDETELRRLLAISWASETQLLGSVGNDAFLRYSNAWAPVQAYYAVYMAIHAWFAVSGMGGLVDDHTSSLRSVVSQTVERKLLPLPFGVTCGECPELRHRVVRGVPADANVDGPFEILAAPTLRDFYPRFAKMLETTRDQRLRRLRKEWLRANGRKHMPRAAKEARAIVSTRRRSSTTSGAFASARTGRVRPVGPLHLAAAVVARR